MKNSKTLLCLLAWTAALMGGTGADDHTFVSNQSSHPLRATTSYQFGSSGFVNRLIEPRSFDSDEYSSVACSNKQGGSNQGLTVDVWIDGGPHVSSIPLPCDYSVVGFDNSGGGVDVYYSAYGNINQPDGTPVRTLKTN